MSKRLTQDQKEHFLRVFDPRPSNKASYRHPKYPEEKLAACELIIKELTNVDVFTKERLAEVKKVNSSKGAGTGTRCFSRGVQTKYTGPAYGRIDLNEAAIAWLIRESQAIFKREPALLELEAPVKVCGDFHGQFHDMLQMFEMAGGPPGRSRRTRRPVNETATDVDIEPEVVVTENKYLIMGDYVDRGQCSTETICLLLALKIRYPNHLYMTRGNHECEAITRTYGFFDECKRRHSLTLYK